MKKTNKTPPKSDGQKQRQCLICGRDSAQIKRFISHHFRYESPGVEEITGDLCLACHNWLHGRATYNHPFYKKHGKAEAPREFARCVCDLYEFMLNKE